MADHTLESLVKAWNSQSISVRANQVIMFEGGTLFIIDPGEDLYTSGLDLLDINSFLDMIDFISDEEKTLLKLEYG